MCLKFGVARYCLNKLTLFKYNKTGALLERFDTIGEQCICKNDQFQKVMLLNNWYNFKLKCKCLWVPHWTVWIPWMETLTASPVRGPYRAISVRVSHGARVEICDLLDHEISAQPCQAIQGLFPDVRAWEQHWYIFLWGFHSVLWASNRTGAKIVVTSWLCVTEAFEPFQRLL